MPFPCWRYATRLLCAAALASPLLVSSADAAGVGAASSHNGELDVFLRHDGDGTGTDSSADSLVLLQRLNGAWQTPVNLGGSVHKDSEIAATSPTSGKLAVAVRWSDNTIREREWTSTTGWGSWVTIGTNASAGPAIAAYGSGNILVGWRSASNTIQLRHKSSTAWAGYSGFLSTQSVAADTGPALIPSGSGVEIDYFTPSFSTPVRTIWDGSGAPESEDNWTDPEFILGTSPGVKRTITSGDAGRFIGGGASRHIIQLVPGTGSASGSTIDMGGTVAGSTATSRTGESTIPNTPAAVRAYETDSSTTQRYELFWRTDDGCIATRTSSTLTPATSWSATTTPNLPTAGRCEWPVRPGQIPLMHRLDPTEWEAVGAAHDGWLSGTTSAQASWYAGRDQAVVFHRGTDWASDWAVRNWHGNAWVYRKSTSYIGADGDSDTKTNGPAVPDDKKQYFVKLTGGSGAGHYAAVNYECYTAAERFDAAGNRVHYQGCTQPLLDVTSAAARTYWLYGADGTVDSSTPARASCQQFYDEPNGIDYRNEGVLDVLACTTGPNNKPSWSTLRGNPKGVWLDDVLADLKGGGDGTGESHVADYVTGARVTNDQLASVLPFTTNEWAAGLATMIADLRTGINALKAAGTLTSDQGQIAVNYKWSEFGFAQNTNPSIANDSPAGPESGKSAAQTIIENADLVELESGWIDGGLQPGSTSTAWSFQRKQNFIDQVHALGGNVLEEKTDSGAFFFDECRSGISNAENAAHYETAQYNLAATLLTYEAGDWVGDICEKFHRGWDGYQTDLGAPTGGRQYLDSAKPLGVQTRAFERGFVAVAPPYNDSTITSSNLSACGDGVVQPCLIDPLYPGYNNPTTSFTVPVPAGSKWRPTGSNTLQTISGTSITLHPRQGAVIYTP
ncbi:MAG: hypothetical protein QM679_08255 [Patulibacter sp.]